MAEQIPSDLIISDVSITNMHRVYSSTSISGIQYRRDSGVQQYRGTITLTAEGFNGAKRLNGFLAKLKGRLNSFEIELGGAYAEPDINVLPTLINAHGVGSTNINVSGYSGPTILAGSVFTLPNESKLYTILDDIPTSGNPSVDIVPAIKNSHAASEPINFRNPKFTAILDINETTIIHGSSGFIPTAVIAWSEVLY